MYFILLIILIISGLLDLAGIVTYYLYLKTTLEFHMNDEMIQNMISHQIGNINADIRRHLIRKLIWIVANIIVFSVFGPGLTDFGHFIDNNNYDSFVFSRWYFISDSILNLMIKIHMTYLYYIGYNNFCHYWCSKQWEEFEKYDETERTHQAMIRMARVCCIMILSLIVSSIQTLLRFMYFIYTYCSDDYFQIWKYIADFGYFMDIIVTLSSIYFIYEFSHMNYEKWCCCLDKYDKKLQRYFKEKLKREFTENPTFDGEVYTEYICNRCKCCPCYHTPPDDVIVIGS